MPRLLTVLLLGFSLPATAAEYRRITVTDGRVLVAEVADTTDKGLQLILHQGTTLVGFQDVVSIEEVDARTWDAVEDWQLVVVPPTPRDSRRAPELLDTLTTAAADIPATHTLRPVDLATLSVSDRGALANCGTDRTCLQRYLDRSGAHVLVAARVQGPEDHPEIVVAATYAGAPRSWREVAFDRPVDDAPYVGVMRQAIETALHLDPRPLDLTVVATPAPGSLPGPTGADQPDQPERTGALPTPDDGAPTPATPDTAATPATPDTAAADTAAADTAAADTATARAGDTDRPGRPGQTAQGPSLATLRALSWVPLPGTPSLARGDWGGVAASMGVAVPGTAVMVAIAGQASFTREQLIATGAGSFYVLTVAMNKAFGLRGLGGGLAAQPVDGGGLVVGYARPLGGSAR